MQDLKSTFLFEMQEVIGDPHDLGNTPHGNRMIYSSKGGTVKGPEINGEILPGGGDWFLLRSDGIGQIDVRETIRTGDGHLIYLQYQGILDISAEVMDRIETGEDVDLSEYYCRVTLSFETASEKYTWLQKKLAVGICKLVGTGTKCWVYAID